MRPVIEALKRQPAAQKFTMLDLEGETASKCVASVNGALWERPDGILLLGDRYAILAAALCATVARIPIAHIHGGEASFGSFDNQIRDAITKLAHIHFVAAEPMRQRLLDLGEEPERIHVVGAPGLDNVAAALNMPCKRQNVFVVTYHPPTLGEPTVATALLAALRRFPDYRVMWTGTNNDPGAEDVDAAFRQAGHEDADCSPGEYLDTVRQCAAVIGNSSSGIIEVPSLGVPTVNVGPRQDGRLKGPSVIDCPEDEETIVEAIERALHYDGPYDNPYGGTGASGKIAAILATAEIDMVKRWRS